LKNTEQYYESIYKDRQLKADLDRINRLRFLFNPVPAGLKILDIGCGPGVDVDFLVKAGNEIHGIDISNEALSHAQVRGIVTHKIDLSKKSKLPFDEESFDIIIATDILEHLFLPEVLLQECARLLLKNGVLIASVPNHFFWKMRLRILLGCDLILPFHPRSRQWDYFHIRFFTPKGFEELLGEARFKIIERYYDRFINVPRGLPRTLDRKVAKRFPGLFSMHFFVKAVKK
jgi:methionine biosynthesis protein MetW